MDYRIITAPVIIPEQRDCDYDKGEPPLTKEQIRNLKQTFDNDYQLIDYDHQIADNTSQWYKKTVGTPERSWITRKPTTYTDILGQTRTIPEGTWWLQSRITDPAMIKLIDDKLVTAYSITVGNKALCDQFKKKLTLASKNNKENDLHDTDTAGLVATKTHKTLIKDIIDPVGFTVSLTGLPCVGSATFSRTCLNKTAQKTDNGGKNMSEETTNNETRFSVSEILGLQKIFANKNDKEETSDKNEEEKAPTKEPEQKEKYVTEELLDEKLEEQDQKIEAIDKKIDKILEKIEEPEKEKEEEIEEEEEDKKGEGQTANKNNPPESSQLDNTNDGNNQNTANKNNSTIKANIMQRLNRKGNGEYKFPKTH